ncbi:Growth-regulating factor 4 [Apostasia shenzhenica]|uniref:Growth-regulating factor n=1 Tax=Apostasia shenzhenica TaxID=1088818 RepID=A0A2I0BHD7_9ASPA|nr:Growth-regulating factor 4 [Apostasia shenzhenica]
MMAGASVPLELILPLKRSLLALSPYYHQNSMLYQHLQPAMMHSGYWGRYVTDPEPGRCRRTDGKKWRCSRDVVTGQKYCERHVHRGRNRSRKLVEVPKPTTDSGSKSMALPSFLMTNKDTNFMLTEPLPALGILPLDQRPLCDKDMEGCSVGGLCSSLTEKKEMQGGRPDGRILRRFFDDWPRSEQESNTNLSISIPGDSSSDYSLKLSTGIGRNKDWDGRVMLHAGNWSGWGSQGGEAAMGGPLAEALRSSTASTPSPTSVLCKLNGSLSETSSSSA